MTEIGVFDVCPDREFHGNPARYCPSCGWIEPTEPAFAPGQRVRVSTGWMLATVDEVDGKQVTVTYDRRTPFQFTFAGGERQQIHADNVVALGAEEIAIFDANHG